MTRKEYLLAWLTDAYGAEIQAKKMMQAHAEDAKDMPEVAQRIEQHIQETEDQAERLKNIVEKLGGDVSSAKSALGSMMGMLGGSTTEMYKDQLIKNAMSDYAFENFEIASYTALIAAAEELGENEIVEDLETSLKEEQDMADFLEDHLPATVSFVLNTVTEEAKES